jgi:hypothetical protein
MFHGARILVAPLDWGLGHAARCVPVVKALLHHGAVPVIAADAGPLALLRAEFPDLEHVRLPGITIRYARGSSQLWTMARQFPAMLRSVREEQAALQELRRHLRVDAVISDQRFGVRADDIPSVVITHQVFPFTPLAQGAMRKLNLRHLARFQRCWVMDEPEAPGLAGALSHGTAMPANARYIGVLSRMNGDAPLPARAHDVVAVISGPEPQRTVLEERILQQLGAMPGAHLLVRGLPGSGGMEQRGNTTLVPHLGAVALASELRHAGMIVSRTGYTTIMDLVAMGRTALVVPTPGQEEQEYLGQLHRGTGRFVVQQQDTLDLPAGRAQLDAHQRSGPVPNTSGELLTAALQDLADLLRWS